jgi:hypothetical protein
MFDRGTTIEATDRAVAVGQDNNGTVITGDVHFHFTATSNPTDAESEQSSNRIIDALHLRQIARQLLAVGSPPSLLPLFPGASPLARQSLEQLSQLRRTVSDENAQKQKSAAIAELLDTGELHHLLVAPPGSGKTHALWHAAREMLESNRVVPIFLPVGTLETWADIVELVASVDRTIDVTTLLHDKRVCVLLDGWSQFASHSATERARAMRVLSPARVIANGRRGTDSDAIFRLWTLDRVPVAAVRQVIKSAFPVAPSPEPALTEFLRLPLAFSLYILLGGSALTRGELLSRLHQHLSRNFPDSFRAVLSGAVASISLLQQDGTYSQLQNEVRRRAMQESLADPLVLLDRLGTLEDRAGTILPVHDLYWSWLAGVGLMSEDRGIAPVLNLATRESYELALESGLRSSSTMVAAVSDADVLLGAILWAHLDARSTSDEAFPEAIKAMFADDRLPVRCRAALAGFRSRRPELLAPALRVLTEVTEVGLYIWAFDAALVPSELFPNRGIIANWIGAGGTDQMIAAIANRGNADWGPWLAQLANSDKLPARVAAAAALACEARLPEWVLEHLPEVIKTQSWNLRAVAARGTNIEFAHWLAQHYEKYIDVAGGSQWFHLNKVLIGCGDDAVFENLLARFPSMPKQAQETLGYAIVDVGDPWVARFQEKALIAGAATQHHTIMDVVSLNISDATARTWIENGITQLGWRILIARHGNAIVPEMIQRLPASFDGIPDIPVLGAMQFLTLAPASLAMEIWGRVRGSMQPKVMEDVIKAFGRIDPTGIPGLVDIIFKQLYALPTYHLNLVLRLFDEWKSQYGVSVRIRTESNDMSVAEWILRSRLARDKDDRIFRQALGSQKDLAIELIIQNCWSDDQSTKEVIAHIQAIAGYDSKLFERLIAREALANTIPKLFSHAFDTFPEGALLRAIDAPGLDFHELLGFMAMSSTPTHAALHKEIARRVLGQPLNLHVYRNVAKILRVHPRAVLLELLKCVMSGGVTSNELWLIREIETEYGQLLITESGKWLS